MSRIKVTYEVLCADEETANKVLTEFFPSADTMLVTPGVLGVDASWITEEERR